MQRRRIILDGLADSDRHLFLSAFVERFAQELSFQFPPELGYQYAWELAPVSWSISRGRFWGLHVSVLPKDVALNSLEVTIKGYFPVVRRSMEPIERFFGRWDNLPGPGKWFLSHFVVPLLLVPVMALLPFLAASRLATLLLRPDVLVATRRLDSLWPEIQASWPTVVSLSRSRSPVVTYSLAVTAVASATVGCFSLAGLASIGESWRAALYVVGIILALTSLVLSIALIMTILGFEVEP